MIAPRDTARGAVLVLLSVLLGALLAIVHAAGGPDPAAIAALRPWVFRFVRSRLAPATRGRSARGRRTNPRQAPALDPEDVTQEVLLAAVVALPSFRPELGTLRGWITGIAYLTIAYRLRAERSHMRTVRAFQDASPWEAPSHEEIIAAGEIIAALQKVTTAERWRVWFAHDGEGRTAVEIARREGTPVTRIEHWIRQARRDFANALAKLESEGEQ